VFHPLRHRPAPDQHSQLHVDRERLLGQVGRGEEQPLAIGNGTLDVQDADLVVVTERNRSRVGAPPRRTTAKNRSGLEQAF
jgi:hypothetical protein